MNGPYSEIGKGRVIGEYGWHKEADGVVRAALLEVCKDFPDDEAMRLYWADYLLSRLAELYPEIIWRWPSTNSAGLQRTVRFSRYAWSMGTHAAKNILLATLALALGLALRAVTEFGFGYDLASFKNHSDKIADRRSTPPVSNPRFWPVDETRGWPGHARPLTETNGTTRLRDACVKRPPQDEAEAGNEIREAALARADHLPGQIIFQRPNTPRFQ